MQLKDEEEQKSASISSQLNLPIKAEGKTENTATNASSKEKILRNHLSNEIRPLFVLMGVFGTLGLGALFTLGIFAVADMFTTSDTCGAMQSEKTTQAP